MRADRIQRLQTIRNELITILDAGQFGLKQGDLIRRLTTENRTARQYTAGELQQYISDALRIYDKDFYRQPGTQKWFLGRRARFWLRKAEPPRPTAPTYAGTTAIAKIHDALEAKSR